MDRNVNISAIPPLFNCSTASDLHDGKSESEAARVGWGCLFAAAGRGREKLHSCRDPWTLLHLPSSKCSWIELQGQGGRERNLSAHRCVFNTLQAPMYIALSEYFWSQSWPWILPTNIYTQAHMLNFPKTEQFAERELWNICCLKQHLFLRMSTNQSQQWLHVLKLPQWNISRSSPQGIHMAETAFHSNPHRHRTRYTELRVDLNLG